MVKVMNRGVLLGQRDTDWIAGSIGALNYEVRNASGDWRPYLVAKERQTGKEDSMACVSFSACTSIEIQEKFLTGKESNYSDRWTAVRSETMPQGNFIWKVGDTVRKDGMVLESSYPAPADYTFAQYHAPIPEPKLSQLIAEGQEWLSRWQVNTEFIPATKEEMLKHIKQAPLQIVIPGHAVVGFLCEADILNYFDTYRPFEKTTPYSNIQTAYKYVLTKKEQSMTNSILVKRGSEYGFFDPATTEEGLISQMLNRGIKPPQDANGRLIWSEVDKLLKGQVV